MRTIKGKRVLVTGAGRGIGLAMAQAWAREGAHVLLTDVDKEVAVEAAQQVGGGAQGAHLDITDAAEVLALRDRLLRHQGPLDLLVNNAGIVFPGPFLEVPLDRHLQTYQVNIEGLVTVTHAFLPQLLERPEAYVVNMASASGLTSLPSAATYASSKWAVVGFSESLRCELKRRGLGHVGITTVCPAYVDTGMFAGVRPPPWIPFLDAHHLARKVVKAVKQERPMLLEPWLVKVTPLLMATLPRAITDRLAELLGVNRSLDACHGPAGTIGHGCQGCRCASK
jgi:short-subunit dehydrogenase